jgi:DNA polymerase-3 subunit delta'
MAWSSVIGQERVKNILQHAILEHKIPHAYCLYGIRGIGKDALALEFAKTVNCMQPRILPGYGIEACDECHSCYQAARLEHPNIRLIFSLPAGKSSPERDDSPVFRLSDDQIALLQEQLHIKAANPYHRIQLPNATQIRISAIRDIKKSIMMSAAQQGRRCIIISEADQMTNEAANAFLKTLEEPHQNITLLLTTAQKDLLPRTILSRCQQVYCDPLNDNELSLALELKHGLPQSEGLLISSFAQGSYARATEFIDEDMRALRLEIVEILRAVLRKNGYKLELMHHVDTMASSKDRNKVSVMLTLLLLWLRDCYACSVNGPDSAHIINIDQRETIARFTTAFAGADYPAAIQAVEMAIEQIRRNVQIQLVLITLLLICREIFLFRKSDLLLLHPQAQRAL